ncbi:hypothetical protein [Laceyella sacchari]|jgi:membrane protein insertase Oxa1/YidC/SpoIIIJ|uniref:Uncharacterized protein n=1 Tax=Laceyella sacchari TaxID=37482 RepID=A0ABY5U833_LACSH|nr:hypothetical protein [Laceyella sacchari]TCW40537.1 hypothetical protein EDC32_101179 [Laceyella sacchari]UWE04188.1 hypothetical protein NYR52_03220 [Laceyella sacchari]
MMSTFIRRFGPMLLLAAALLLLGGCQAPGTHDPGWFAGLLAGPFTDLIKMVAGLFGDNYGLSIIMITLLIRLALLPIMLKQRCFYRFSSDDCWVYCCLYSITI